METLFDRMLRAAKLDEGLYWELARDRNVQVQAAAVILIVGLAGVLWRLPFLRSLEAGVSLTSLLSTLALSIAGTAIWWLTLTFVYYYVGTRFLHGYASFESVLYAIAFALTPAVLQVLLFIPNVGRLLPIVVGVWLFLTESTAVRQTLGLNPLHAFILVFATSFLLRIVLSMLLPGMAGVLSIF